MSYAAPFSLVSLPVPDHDESMAERLRWPLAGSAFLHAVVFVALLSLRVVSSFEQPSEAYEVTLVTLPEIAATPTAPPVKQARPNRNAGKVPPPKAKAEKAPAAAPQRKTVIPPRKAASTTGSRSPVKARVPERVTESLVSALDAVVVPKTQTLPLPRESAPVRPSVPAPVERSPAVEKDVPAFKAPPQPPELVAGKPAKAPTPAPSVGPLASKLKQAVGATSVPGMPEQVSKRVSPTVAPEREQKSDTPKAPESPAITLPSRAPRLTAVAPLEAPKKETSRQTVRKSSTVESLKEALQSVRIPDPERKTVSTKRAGPLVSETGPPAKADEGRNQSFAKIMFPQAPQLAKIQPAVLSAPTGPKAESEPDLSSGQEIDDIPIPDKLAPDALAFNFQPVSNQAEGGSQETLDNLQVSGASPNVNIYWGRVRGMIDKKWIVHRVKFQHPLQVILAFRIERNGRVTDLSVFRSSGNPHFDETAKRAVRATRLPPFRPNMRDSFYDVKYKFTGPENQ